MAVIRAVCALALIMCAVHIPAFRKTVKGFDLEIRNEEGHKEMDETEGDPCKATLKGAENDYITVGKTLGQGGFGKVCLAGIGDAKGEPAVVKVSITRNESGVAALTTEAAAMSTVRECPNVAMLRDQGMEDGKPFLVMTPFAPKGDLATSKRKTGTSDYKKFTAKGFGPVIRLATQVLEALKCMSDKGVIHSDIKTENILLPTSTQTGRNWFDLIPPDHAVTLTDFGLAVQLSPEEMGFANAGTLQLAKRGCDSTLNIAAPECLIQNSVYEGFSWSFDMFSFGALIANIASNTAPPKDRPNSDYRKDVYSSWCRLLGDQNALEETLKTDELLMGTMYGRVALDNQCLRELVIRSLVLDPASRISPDNALMLAQAASDETACQSAIDALPPRVPSVQQGICEALYTVDASSTSFSEALKAALEAPKVGGDCKKLKMKKAREYCCTAACSEAADGDGCISACNA